MFHRTYASHSALSSQGFGLLDALLAIALTGILAAVAVPPLSDALALTRERATHAQLLADLRWAQHEAKRLGQTVTVSPLSAAKQSGCRATSQQDWSCGWLIYLDQNYDQQFDDSAEHLLLRHTADAPVNVTSTRPWLRYLASGRTSDVQSFRIGLHDLEVVVSWVRISA